MALPLAWLANPRKRTATRRRRRRNRAKAKHSRRRRMPAALRRYWAMKKGHHSTRRRRRRSTRARRRRNPFIAEYLLGNPRRRHRRRHNARGHHRVRHHRRYRRNPFGGALVGQLQRNPVRYLQIGGMGALGIYGTITGGNWLVAQFLPSYQAGADWTSRAVRYGSRIASAAVLDM